MAAVGAAVAAGIAPPARVGVVCGQLIDGRSARPMRNAALLIEGERIVKVGGRDILPAGVEIIDLGD
ncbi:MAG: amidohydrolase family protein, partial [Candidatus Polarisedimenticolia bacterium]